MKNTIKKAAALTLTLAFAFGINVGLNTALDSDVLDFIFTGSSDTTIQQSEQYASGNSMLPPNSPRPRDLEPKKDEDDEPGEEGPQT